MRPDIQDMIQRITERCLQNKEPICSSICPLGLDARSMLDKIRSGNLEAAWRYFRKNAIMPHVVCRLCAASCQKSCPSNLSLRSIERYLCDHGSKTPDRTVRVLQKRQRVCVIGGGPAGLACAVRLARRGYPVDLFEKSSQLGGCVRNLVDGAVLDADLALISQERIAFHLSEEISTIPMGYDAVCIAADMEYRTEADSPIFVANAATPVAAIREGLHAAMSIADYLSAGRLPIPRNPYVEETAISTVNQVLTLSEMLDEVGKCTRCSCTVCTDGCPMLQHYKRTPQKIAEDVTATLNAIPSITTHVAQKQINACKDCDWCSIACPEGVDFGAIFMESRRILQEHGTLPPAYHDFWLRDLEHADKNTVLHADSSCEYLFFPGCQLSAVRPELIISTMDVLKKAGYRIGLYTACCGIEARWAGQEDLWNRQLKKLSDNWNQLGQPVILWACPTCKKSIRAVFPEEKLWSVYEVLAKHVEQSKHEGRFLSVFDPCSAQMEHNTQKAVRHILKTAGIQLKEREKTGASCCGWGGQTHGVNHELVKQSARMQAETSTHDFVTYCANCMDVFVATGKPTIHVLDMFSEVELEQAFCRSKVTLSERHYNREKLYRQLHTQSHLRQECLLISNEIQEQMEERLILQQDLERVISHCEQSGSYILLQDGNRVGHLQIGYTTFWVQYRVVVDKYQVCRAYSHRMELVKSGAPKLDTNVPKKMPGIVCGSCKVELVEAPLEFQYLGHQIKHRLPVCPQCGQPFLSEDLVLGRMQTVESSLEDK